jgi:hypothetical protein
MPPGTTRPWTGSTTTCALESKLRAVQDALELLLGVARDRRLLWLEVAIVGLICLEVVLGLLR